MLHSNCSSNQTGTPIKKEQDHGDFQENLSSLMKTNHDSKETTHCKTPPNKLSSTSFSEKHTGKRACSDQSPGRQESGNFKVFSEEKSRPSGFAENKLAKVSGNPKRQSAQDVSKKFGSTKISRQSDNSPLDLSCHNRHSSDNVLKKPINSNFVSSISHHESAELLQAKQEPPNDGVKASETLCKTTVPKERNTVSKDSIKLKPSQLRANAECGTNIQRFSKVFQHHLDSTVDTEVPRRYDASRNHSHQEHSLWSILPSANNPSKNPFSHISKNHSFDLPSNLSTSHNTNAFKQLSIGESSTSPSSGTNNGPSSVKDQLHNRQSPEHFYDKTSQGVNLNDVKPKGRDVGDQFEGVHPKHLLNSPSAFHPYKFNRCNTSNPVSLLSTMAVCADDTHAPSDTLRHTVEIKDSLPEKPFRKNNLAFQKVKQAKTLMWPKFLAIKDNSLGSSVFSNSIVKNDLPSTPSQQSSRNDLYPAVYGHIPFPHHKRCVSRNSGRPVTFKPCKIPCTICGRTYATTGALAKHAKTHQDPTKAHTLNCTICSKECSSLSALRMHIRTHTLPCECYICGKAFSRTWLLQGHIRTHTGEKPYQCMVCTRAFADRSNLRAHMQTHETIKRYSCKNCEKTFSRISLLKRHQEHCENSKSQKENVTLSSESKPQESNGSTALP